MSKFVVIVFPSEAQTYQGTRALKDLHTEGNLTLYGMAVTAKDAQGKLEVKDAVDAGPLGTAVGALVGGLVGAAVAAAGFDAATGVCAAIIWDYSNNDLELERHCDDFGTYPSFPYVILREPPESCDYLEGLWDDEILEPEVASGCFDPLEETVDVQIDVFSVPTFYRIIMNNEP